MEHVAAMSDVEWNSFNGMCNEEADFMAQLLKNCSVPTEVQNNSHYDSASTYCPNHESNMNVVGFYGSSVYSSDETNTTSTHSFPQESNFFPESYDSNMPHQFFITNDYVMNMDHHNNAMEGDNFLNQEVSNDSDESNKNSSEEIIEEKAKPSDMSKKRPRVPRDVQRSKKNTRTKKNVKSDDNEEKYNSSKYKPVLNRQSSMASSCSEDDCNASQELSEKTRASRGSATDPQSLYARKRRERINERLKTLQSLVPNGTKVDISTMLEEAVQYVKFLQLQIKLLSSDEHWMYSPIAYNGMDIARFKNLDS